MIFYLFIYLFIYFFYLFIFLYTVKGYWLRDNKNTLTKIPFDWLSYVCMRLCVCVTVYNVCRRQCVCVCVCDLLILYDGERVNIIEYLV